MLLKKAHKPGNHLFSVGFLVLLLSLPVIGGPTPPTLDCPSYVLMDPDSGEVIYGRNIHDQRVPASTTKIMTALLAMEKSGPNDIVTVSHRADCEGGSSLGIKEGEKIPLADLACAMMVKSGNDAAVAIAEHISGSVTAFCDLMNKRAEELGMVDSHFSSPNGMPCDNHYSSAFDLALLASEAMSHPEFRDWVSMTKVHFDRFGDRDDITFESTNHFLDLFPLATGIKTGYTNLAGFCLVSSAAYRGKTLIAVVLGCERNMQWTDTIDLFDYGFTLYDPDYPAFKEIYERGAVF